MQLCTRSFLAWQIPNWNLATQSTTQCTPVVSAPPINLSSILLLYSTASLFTPTKPPTSTSRHVTTSPTSTCLVMVTPCASPIGKPPMRRDFSAGTHFPHTVYPPSPSNVSP